MVEMCSDAYKASPENTAGQRMAPNCEIRHGISRRTINQRSRNDTNDITPIEKSDGAGSDGGGGDLSR